MSEESKNKHITVLIYLAYIALAVYVAVNWLPHVIVWAMPFLLAYFVAFMTQPLKKFLYKKMKMRRRLASIIAWAVALIVLTGVVGFIVAKIIAELVNFANNSKDYVSYVSSTITYWKSQIETWQAGLPAEYSLFLTNAMESATGQLLSWAGGMSQEAVKWLGNSAAAMPGVLLFWLIFIVASYFMCKDYAKLRRFAMRCIPERLQERARMVGDFTAEAVGKYFRGMGIMLGIVFCVLFVGLLILGTKYAFWIALILAIFELLPLIGTGIVLTPWGLWTIVFGKNVALGVGLLVLYVVNVAIRQLIEPKVMSKSLGLYPLVTLAAVYVGLKTWGFAGVICFPILALVGVYLWRAGVFKVKR